MATEAMDEDWRRVREQVKSIWSETEFDDKAMKRSRGNLTKMINLIQQKTGEPREQIRRKMNAVI
jgi:hypothetical protein